MLRYIHITAFDRIAVYLIQLLPHQRLGFDQLRMANFLPDLILAFNLMRPPQQRQ